MIKWKKIEDEYHNYNNIRKFHRFTMHHKANMSVNHIVPITDEFLDEIKEKENKNIIYLTPVDKSKLDKISLKDALKQRRTSWQFIKPMSFDELSLLLNASLGKTLDKIFDGFWVGLRAYASAGALYSVEPYVYINNVNEKVNNKIWHYDVNKNSLSYVNDTNIEIVNQLTSTTKFGIESFDFAKMIVFFVANFNLIQKKYGMLAYRLVFLEAGHMSQNIQIVASALGYSSVPLGGFYDLEVEKILGLDSKKICIYMHVIG